MAMASTRPSLEQVWDWLAEVPDPEIPVVSVVDLGIVRDIQWNDDALTVAITPTYSGCPATSVIALEIENALRRHGLDSVRMERRISPPWTTDWITETGREKLKGFGIAPPVGEAGSLPGLSRLGRKAAVVACPHCGSTNTSRVSEFGSTPCKAQYRCQDCLEPFDYFKCI
jgi:ring-1,2-phenylacetyl-CoA epoxidase subunit PaaD